MARFDAGNPMTVSPQTELARFQGDKSTYIREHIILAILGSALMTGVLILMNNPDPWVGVVGGVAAIALRGFYIATEQLAFVWVLTDQRLISPNERDIPLSEIKEVRGIFSAVQVICDDGQKYLLKYQPDREGTIKTIRDAVARHKGTPP